MAATFDPTTQHLVDPEIGLDVLVVHKDESSAHGRIIYIADDGRRYVYSHLGTRIGRPKIERDEDLVLLLTRIDNKLKSAINKFAAIHDMSQQKMHEKCIRYFLDDKPVEKGLVWQKAQRSGAGGGFSQVNLKLPASLAEEVKRHAAACGISVTSYIYTALYYGGRLMAAGKF